MDRKSFILTSGTFLSATMLTRLFGSGALLTLTGCSSKASERDDYHKFAKPILKALAIGLNAPSAHNTQPWKFKIISDNEADVFIDKDRLLPETDPPTRQIHMSGGCFLETIAIGASLINHTAQIDLFPQGTYDQTHVGSLPFSKIRLAAIANQVHHPLAAHIFNRRTSRLVYDGDLIAKEEADKLISETAPQFSTLIIQHTADEMKPFLDIFKEAMKVESYNLPTNEETRRMFRFDSEEIETQRDGLTFEGQGTTGIKKMFTKMAVKNNKESWNKPSNIEAGLEKFNKGVDSAKGIAYWITEGNDLTSWVNSGRDVQRFWLVLTKNNLYAHPLNQAIQEYKAMDVLRMKMDTALDIKSGQKIQMIVRIGKSETPFKSFRRHLSDVINA